MLWTITFDVNAYDQFGQYIVAVYAAKPSEKDVCETLLENEKKNSYRQERIERLAKELVDKGKSVVEDYVFYLENVSEGKLIGRNVL